MRAVQAGNASLPYGGSLRPAGGGVDVAFSGVTLARPLTVTFKVGREPFPAAIAVVAHRSDDGTWTLAPAGVTGDSMTVTTGSFSLQVPAWLDPRAWFRWLGGRLASLAGGRTAPIGCPAGAPGWASLANQTNMVHACLAASVDQGSHVTRAEVRIKSNRSYVLEVDLPPGADYTWVEGQPWSARAAIWPRAFHQDPNQMILLPAGGTLTAGYRQPAADQNPAIWVKTSLRSEIYSATGDLIAALTSQAADATGPVIASLYLAIKCSGTFDPASLTASKPMSAVTFGSVMSCLIGEAVSNLSSPAKAYAAARSLLEPGVSQADLATATQQLTDVGGALLRLGWIVRLWPLLQLGYGGTGDALASLLTKGSSALITLSLKGAQGPCATGDLSISLGPVNAAGGHDYQAIDFRNHSGHACTLYGYPGVSFGAGTPVTPIGPPASRNPATPAALITLLPGEVASALLSYYNAEFFDPSACAPQNATSIQVYPPNQTTAMYLADNVPVCLKPNLQQIMIDAVKAGPG